MHPFNNVGMKILGLYFRQYQENGGQFVRDFINQDYTESCCGNCIDYATRHGLVIEQNEKVKAYVERLQIGSKGETLEKLLNIFKMIKEK